MSAAGNNEEICYYSLFRHGVDEKRRVQVPAKWRPAQPEVELLLVLWPNQENQKPFLVVLPPERQRAMVEKIRSLPAGDETAAALRRLLGANSASVTLDKAGRICLPDELAKAAGISDQAVLVGAVDRYEVWSPDHYETSKAGDEALKKQALKLI